jgi:hypothetical protein
MLYRHYINLKGEEDRYYPLFVLLMFININFYSLTEIINFFFNIDIFSVFQNLLMYLIFGVFIYYILYKLLVADNKHLEIIKHFETKKVSISIGITIKMLYLFLSMVILFYSMVILDANNIK